MLSSIENRGLLVFPFVLVVISVHCSGTPNLTILKGDCGQVTYLTCKSPDIVPGKPYHWYIWDRKKTPIYYYTENGKLVNNAYIGTIERGRLELQIHNTSVSHSNVYSCDYDYRDSNKVALIVACLTVIPGKCGDVTALVCSINGTNSETKYAWHYDTHSIYDQTKTGELVKDKYRGTIQNETLVLEIHRTNNLDAGNYSCRYGFGESVVKVINKTCGPTLTISRGSCGSGERQLTCSWPEGGMKISHEYYWLKDNTKIYRSGNNRDENKYRFSGKNGDLLLNILNFSAADIGQYFCDYEHLRSNPVTLERCIQYGDTNKKDMHVIPYTAQGSVSRGEGSRLDTMNLSLLFLFTNGLIFGLPRIMGVCDTGTLTVV